MIAPRNWRVSISDLVRNALSSPDVKGHLIDVEVPNDLPSVVTDPDLLERVITNVVSNAVRFSPVVKSVRLTAGLTATGIEVLVIDHGPGTRDPRRRIRTTDEAASAPRVADEDLSLSVAAGFIKLLGGELRFDDTPGGGLTVAICLAGDATATLGMAPDPEAVGE
jgi:two-component system sensor histidine kinase KdpD